MTETLPDCRRDQSELETGIPAAHLETELGRQADGQRDKQINKGRGTSDSSAEGVLDVIR